MRVKTETYPFPLRQMFRRFGGTWEVELYRSVARVTMRYEVELSPLGKHESEGKLLDPRVPTRTVRL